MNKKKSGIKEEKALLGFFFFLNKKEMINIYIKSVYKPKLRRILNISEALAEPLIYLNIE